VEGLPSKVANSIEHSAIVEETYKPGETHEGILYKGHDYGPQLPGDVQQAFPWASGDAIDRLASEGYSFSEAFENISRGSDWWEAGDQPRQQAPEKHDRSDGKGWWE